MSNDRDADGDGLRFQEIGTARHGTASPNTGGAVRYTAGAGYAGTDSLRYLITDGRGGTVSATITVRITAALATTGENLIVAAATSGMGSAARQHPVRARWPPYPATGT